MAKTFRKRAYAKALGVKLKVVGEGVAIVMYAENPFSEIVKWDTVSYKIWSVKARGWGAMNFQIRFKRTGDDTQQLITKMNNIKDFPTLFEAKEELE